MDEWKHRTSNIEHRTSNWGELKVAPGGGGGFLNGVLNRKFKHNAFDLRQFFSGLKIAPCLRIPISETAESFALNNRDFFYRGSGLVHNSVFVFTCVSVAHGLDCRWFVPRRKIERCILKVLTSCCPELAGQQPDRPGFPCP
jgi:hypothetical protein